MLTLSFLLSEANHFCDIAYICNLKILMPRSVPVCVVPLRFWEYFVPLKVCPTHPASLNDVLLHRKKKVREFPVPSRDVTTKLSLGGNNDVITELFLPRGSLVSDIPAGDGKLVIFFLLCAHGCDDASSAPFCETTYDDCCAGPLLRTFLDCLAGLYIRLQGW